MKRFAVMTVVTASLFSASSGEGATTKWKARGIPKPYKNVGRNPRVSGQPVRSMAEAISYMKNAPQFKKDVTELLPFGLEDSVRRHEWPGVTEELWHWVNLAAEHRYMDGECPVCPGATCKAAPELMRHVQFMHIPHGTQYLALTEGRNGKVSFNRVFIGEANAYRVWFRNNAFLDLIAICRNTGLGQKWELSTAYMPPPNARARASAQARAEASIGDVVVHNYAPAQVFGYNPSPQGLWNSRGYSAGSLSWWPSLRTNIRINQQLPQPVLLNPTGGGQQQVPVPILVGPSQGQFPVQSPVQTPIGGNGNQIQGPVYQGQGPQQQR